MKGFIDLKDIGLSTGKILEKDSRGPKAILDRRVIYKVFYYNRHPIRQRIRPNSLRFLKNSKQLQQKGFIAPTVLSIKKLKYPMVDVLSYKMLLGDSLRSLIAKKKWGTDDEIRQLMQYMYQLHQQGVLFRSFHLGNILYQSKSNRFALIDISDIHFYKKPLSFKAVLRNFRHLFRASEDTQFFIEHHQKIISYYIETANLPPQKIEILFRFTHEYINAKNKYS